MGIGSLVQSLKSEEEYLKFFMHVWKEKVITLLEIFSKLHYQTANVKEQPL